MKKVEIKRVRLHDDGHRYYLTVIADIENEDGSINRVTYPSLNLFDKKPSFRFCEGTEHVRCNDVSHSFLEYLDIDRHSFVLGNGDAIDIHGQLLKRGVLKHIEIIKEPDPIEVTMEEIENKFGRKVKIVNKKEKK